MINSEMLFPLESPQYLPRMLYFGASHGEAQVETITAPAVAAATQGDFILIKNQAGQSEALWLDIDADGTAPTADEYLNADIQTMVSVATGDDEIDVAAAIVAASTISDVTLTDNLDGTIEMSQDIYGDCDNAAPYSEDGSGAGSISVAVDQEGVDASMDNGNFDGEILQESIGVLVISFNQPFLRVPEGGITVKTDNRIARISAADVESITVEINDLSGNPADGDISALICGSDRADYI